MLRTLYLLAALMLLGGCNGMPTAYVKDPVYDQAFVIHSGGPLPMMLMATAIQWNADYAVTVKHLPYVAGSEYQGKGDVQFFRHKAHVPMWRQYTPGETVTAVGFNSLYMPVMGQGQTLPAVVRLDARDGVFYATHNGPTAKGMSGGPVFGRRRRCGGHHCGLPHRERPVATAPGRPRQPATGEHLHALRRDRQGMAALPGRPGQDPGAALISARAALHGRG
ncbi:hypothetical protein LN139_11530 [Pseudomonas sp. KNUC1026]|nr:hypothetical protein [Pseudomonas sp. KNUC1026]UFH51535.1 hypothetical protein LN139_11530 [Pseudomonas sp. KNUC1026]